MGLPTVSISLVREHTERIRPPRALWVPFELGRPFGAPRDADQQTRVLSAALSLLERSDGPVILHDSDEIYQAIAAVDTESDDGLFCMLPMAGHSNADDPLIAEFNALAPWYQHAVEQNAGRTTVGVSPLPVKQALQFIRDLVRGLGPEPAPGQDLAHTLRFACEDLRSWYLEAAQAKPGSNQSSQAAAAWFWGQTHAGQLLFDAQRAALAHADKKVQWVGQKTIVPRSQAHRAPGD